METGKVELPEKDGTMSMDKQVTEIYKQLIRLEIDEDEDEEPVDNSQD